MTRVQTKSLFTGRLNQMDVPASREQLEHWQSGESLLVAIPDLEHDHIEFLVSGMTRAELQERFGPGAVKLRGGGTLPKGWSLKRRELSGKGQKTQFG